MRVKVKVLTPAFSSLTEVEIREEDMSLCQDAWGPVVLCARPVGWEKIVTLNLTQPSEGWVLYPD